VDIGATVLQLDLEQHRAIRTAHVVSVRVERRFGGRWRLADDCDASRLAARIFADSDRLRVAADAIPEPDRERHQPVNHRLLLAQKLPCPCRMARHQRLLSLVENEYLNRSRHYYLCAFARDGLRWLPKPLPS
jgi:hypothetical protein